MPKMKSNSGAKKRFSLRESTLVAPCDEKRMKKLIAK